jgi:hypothetical protein
VAIVNNTNISLLVWMQTFFAHSKNSIALSTETAVSISCWCSHGSIDFFCSATFMSYLQFEHWWKNKECYWLLEDCTVKKSNLDLLWACSWQFSCISNNFLVIQNWETDLNIRWLVTPEVATAHPDVSSVLWWPYVFMSSVSCTFDSFPQSWFIISPLGVTADQKWCHQLTGQLWFFLTATFPCGF